MLVSVLKVDKIKQDSHASTQKSFSFHDQQKKENGTIDSADKEILAEAERLDVRAMGPLILSELLFNENIRDQIRKYKRHFLRVCCEKIVMQ